MATEDWEFRVRREPLIIDFSPTETFKVVDVLKPVAGLGRVLVRREKDGFLYSAFVIPDRPISIGAQVGLIEVMYTVSLYASENSFLAVR